MPFMATAAPAASPKTELRRIRLVPGVMMLRQYRREWLANDLLAGVSVCLVMIPAVLAYAALLGLAPQHGLYAALLPLLVYGVFGSSRQVIVGPDIAITLLCASAIGPLAGGDPVRAAKLAAIVGILAGLLLLLGARARLGAVADFLSKPVLVGYMTGAALILMLSQVDKLLGISLHHTNFFPRLAELARHLSQPHRMTALLGLDLLALLWLTHRLAPQIPGPLVACAAALGLSLGLGLEQQGIAVVGAFPAGLPRPAWPGFSWEDIHSLLPAAIGIALLTYTEGILLGRAFAAKNGYEVDANQELNALGLADVAAGFFQGFCITGSQARTTLNDSAGARTQLSGLVAAASLVLFLLFLTPWIAKLPQVALAAILIYASFGLIELATIRRMYRFSPQSAVIAGLTTLSVLVAGVIPGIVFGVALSLLGLINRISHPPDAVLSEAPGGGFHDLGTPRPGSTIPGLLVYRFYAPLLFSNAGHFVQRVRELLAASQQAVRWFLLDAQAITDIDVTAVEALHDLHRELQQKGIKLKIAHANPPLRELLRRTGLAGELGADSFFASVHECAERFRIEYPLGVVPPR